MRQLTRAGEIVRLKLQGPFLYVSQDQVRAQVQIRQRRALALNDLVKELGLNIPVLGCTSISLPTS